MKAKMKFHNVHTSFNDKLVHAKELEVDVEFTAKDVVLVLLTLLKQTFKRKGEQQS